MISIVIVTCDRLHLLRQTMEKVIAVTSPMTREVIVWNNASSDGTKEYLDGLTDPRLQVIHSPENIGLNAYRPAFERTTQDYLVELDDDVIDAPPQWDRTMLEAYQKVEPENVAYLAADVTDDGQSRAADIRYRRDAHKYQSREVAGVELLDGPAGGWCTMVSRRVDESVGGKKQNPDFIYFSQDTLYTAALKKAGYELALLPSVKVFHASGPAFDKNPGLEELKQQFFEVRNRSRRRKRRIKQWLERVPGVPALNARLKVYTPPRSV